MNYKKELDLYKHTILLNEKDNELIPKNCGHRCVRSTIINRAYYSTFLFVRKYLTKNGFQLRNIVEYKKNNEPILTEHQQIINKLSEINNGLSKKLKQLKRLRKKADYYPEQKLSLKEVNRSIEIMNLIIKSLKLEKNVGKT